jgi:malate dehydrogenase (oxaloacetate-decarboxylating)(NADP+)
MTAILSAGFRARHRLRAGVPPGSISTKMLQELGGAMVIGPLLVGLDRPVQIVQLGAKDNQLVNMAALAAYNVSG